MIRVLTLALTLAAAAPAMATEYSWHLDKTITIDTAPDTEGTLVQALYDSFQNMNWCNVGSSIRTAKAEGQGLNVPIVAFFSTFIALIKPVTEDYTLFTPAVREVEANARKGVVDLKQSYHYELFDTKISGTKTDIPDCTKELDALKVSFDNYLQWRISQVQAGK